MVILSQLADELSGLANDEMMLQVGKGTGWRSKTLGRVLQERLSNEEFDQMVKDFNLGRKLWRRDGRIPLTRQLATAGDQVRAPMGWIKVKLEGTEAWAEEEAVEVPVMELAAAPVVSRAEHLQEGMVLEGTVRGVAKFGAFVDIGVGHDGLVHISELAEDRVRQVEDVVQVGQRVWVQVLKVERRGDKWRIGLTMKGVQQEAV